MDDRVFGPGAHRAYEREDDGLFALKVSFEYGSLRPARVFTAMTQLIEAVERLDKALAWSANAGVEPVLLLQEVQTSSLVTLLRNMLLPERNRDRLATEEEAAMQRFLTASKKRVMRFAGTRDTVTSRDDIATLKGELREVADVTLPERKRIGYHPLADRQVMGNLTRIGEALANLQANDSVSFLVPGESDTKLNAGFRVSQDTVEELLTQQRYTHENRMILKVKKPDYLGDSRWELRHDKQTIEAHIADEEWLADFRSQAVLLGPGDALNADVRSEVLYGFDGEVIRTTYNVVRVHGTHRAEEDIQESLLPSG